MYVCKIIKLLKTNKLVNFNCNKYCLEKKLNKMIKSPKHEETKKIQTKEYSHGKRGWLIVMVILFIIYSIVDNYTRYGVIKNPIDIIFYVNNMIIQHFWLVCLTLLFYSIQILLVYVIEKLLSKEIICEKLGMTLHAFNVFLVCTAYVIVAIKNNINPLISRLILTYVVYTMTKVWSYAYVNCKYRRLSKHTADNLNENAKPYPANITFKNLIDYFVFTPPIEYELSYPQRIKSDWISFIKFTFQLLLVYYGFTFVLIQFILPEVKELRKDRNSFTNIFICALRLILPVNIGWLLFSFVNTYKTFLPAYAAWTGMKSSVFGKDWWNSEDLNIFWRKWNVPVHNALKCNVFIPLIKNGYSTKQAQLVTVAMAGVIHEYLNTLPMRLYSGKAFLVTMLEIPCGNITVWIHKNFGPTCGNLSVWIYLLITHTTAAIFYGLLDNFNEYNL